MNKKQGVIISVLLVLIVCMGILATKLNSDLDYVAGNDISNGKDTVSTDNSNKNTSAKSTSSKSSSSSYFKEQQIIRDNEQSTALQTLKSLIDDEHTAKEERAELSKKYAQLALNGPKQSQIEGVLQGKGYQDTLCYIRENKVTIILKTTQKLTDEQKKQIQDVVMDVTQVRDVEIQVKQ